MREFPSLAPGPTLIVPGEMNILVFYSSQPVRKNIRIFPWQHENKIKAKRFVHDPTDKESDLAWWHGLEIVLLHSSAAFACEAAVGI